MVKQSKYCYANTDILINNLNIKDDNILNFAERELVALRMCELDITPIKGMFDFEHLKLIHKHLFQDIYEWAGNIRKCIIAKEDLFCLPEYINDSAKEIFEKLKKKYYMNYEYEKKVLKLAGLFSDINALHPFREGNGRTQREFIEELAKINGINLDLTVVDQNNIVLASHNSINGNNKALEKIFKKHSIRLTKDEQMKYINTFCSNDMKNEIFV